MNRKILKKVIYQEQNGTKTPIVQKTVEPKIEGAIITAKGASDINVKTAIIQAVEAATGLATHKKFRCFKETNISLKPIKEF